MSPMRERLSRPINGYQAIVIFASCIGLVVASLILSLAVARSSVHSFCDIVVAQTDAYRENPPTTKTGANVARRMEAFRAAKCAGSKE